MSISTFEAYSPRIVSTLFIGEHQINVRELSPESISVETDRHFGPCDGRIETIVGDQEPDVFYVRFAEGIDPNRDQQPIRDLD